MRTDFFALYQTLRNARIFFAPRDKFFHENSKINFFIIFLCFLSAVFKIILNQNFFRSHALSKYSDILTCIETRISMLSMTFLKYIELDVCCFIPGRVIDEVLSVLRLVVENQKSAGKPLRAHEVSLNIQP